MDEGWLRVCGRKKDSRLGKILYSMVVVVKNTLYTFIVTFGGA
jgi:hypothetical protein